MEKQQVIASAAIGMTSPEPGLKRQVMSHSAELMLVRHTMAAGWVGAPHSHPHAQLVYIVHGEIHLTVAGQVNILKTGDSLLVDGDLQHQATAPVDSEVLDVFTPRRDDYA